MGRLEGKVVIITGANSGIGAVAAQKLAAEGARVVMAARRVDKLAEVAEKIQAAGGECLSVPTDIAKEADCVALIAAAVKAYGTVDVMVNNAGYLEEGLKPLEKFTEEDLSNTLNINTKGTMYCMREAAKVMLGKKSGSIVNVSSLAGVAGIGGAAYVASKAALLGVARHSAMRLASSGIRVNTICPGTVVTPMTTEMNQAAIDKEWMGEVSKHCDLTVPVCMPEDVANIIVFLASDESRPLTAQVLVSDFGSSL